MSVASTGTDAADGRPNGRTASLPRRLRFTRPVVAAAMFLMGACGIAYEYVLGVTGNNLIGSSHEQIFVIIGIMMFAMGLGAVVQKRLTGDLLDWFLGVEIALGLLGGASSLLVYVTFVYTASYHVVMYGFAFVVGALIGLEVPLLIRINVRYAASLKANLSDIFCMDYVGSLAGALVFTYVLLSRLSIGRIGLVLGCVNAGVALAMLAFFGRAVRRRAALAAGGIAVLAALLAGTAHADRWLARLEQRCFQDPIIHAETSRYQHIVLTRRDDRLRMYINGHLQFSSRDEHVYHEMLVHVPMAVAPRARRVLILGGGDGLALREVLRYGQVEHVTLVDIDPAVIRLAGEHPDLIRLNRAAFHDARVHSRIAQPAGAGRRITVERPTKLRTKLLDDRRYPLADVAVFTVDADRFVREAGGGFDVALLDFPDPKTVELAKLFSVEFYRALARQLAPGGVVSVQSTSPRRARDVFLCIGQTLRAAGFRALPYHDYLPSFGDWGWHLAWRGEPTVSGRRDRLGRLGALKVETRYATPESIDAAFTFAKGVLDTEEAIRPNTKLTPAIIRHYRRGLE